MWCHISQQPLPCRQIVIVNSWFLERPQKRSRRNQLIHRHLTKTKSIGSGRDPDRESDRQTVRRLWWMVFGVETRREVWGWRWIRIGFAKEQCLSPNTIQDTNTRYKYLSNYKKCLSPLVHDVIYGRPQGPTQNNFDLMALNNTSSSAPFTTHVSVIFWSLHTDADSSIM